MLEDIEAAVKAREFKGERLSVAERNRLIKRALARVFGRENVRVRGSRGTAYGWVKITVRRPKPHEGECDWTCERCERVRRETENRVWDILSRTRLINYLYTYYTDMGEPRKECTVVVDLRGTDRFRALEG